jgi:3-phosphoshikimate 1-carboxyvinyltransferase
LSDVDENVELIRRYDDNTDRFKINSNRSSQFLSGLLLALPLLNEGTIIEVEDATSLPYIDLTIEIMKEFGFEIANDNYQKFCLKSKWDVDYIILNAEGDWSSASYLLVAGAIAGNIKLKGIDNNSKQADKAILEVLKQVGANLEITADSITVRKNVLNSFEYDATNSPDLIPVLVALAVNCEGESIIRGIDRLVNKESNRLATIYSEFKKLNCDIHIDKDSFIIKNSDINGGVVKSHHDHRIAMSLAIAALNANSAITIEDAECVSKSYPNFFEDLKLIGVNINE